MTLEVLVIGAVRVFGSLPVLRWPRAGGLLAIVVDLSGLLLRDTLDLGGIPGRHGRGRAGRLTAVTPVARGGWTRRINAARGERYATMRCARDGTRDRR
jgi:hypothetical protein